MQPPLVIRLNRFAKQVALIVLLCAAALVGWGLLKGLDMNEMLLLAVSLAVSAIPEGLPVVITVVLAVAATRMASRNVIVRRMSAVEGLGSCTMIASDKTGTLTLNMQTLQRIGLPGNRTLEVTGQGYNGTGKVQTADGQKPNDLLRTQAETFSRAAALCNEGTLSQNADGQAWEYTGDAVDVAFLALAYKLGITPAALHESTQFVGTLPFESERKFAAVFYQESETVRIAIKGALETILPRCKSAQGCALDSEAITSQADAFTREGFRVLGVAQGAVPAANFDPKRLADYLEGLELLGVAALQDPLRPEVPPAIAKCHTAGIQVCMITGDHPLTALAIAKQLGIAQGEQDIMTGKELEALGDADDPAFREAVRRKTVFARTSPLQKLQIATALDKLGHFVAMTGDGVNDVPALKKAHISVAMGSGTDMAKDTSDLLLTDDNFASLEAGVEEGRYAYDNIRKVTYLLIATGAAEILLFFLALLAGLPLPLLAAQILWLNLVTNGIQDVAMAFEAGEPGAMQRSPRSRNEGIFNRLMISQVLVSALTMAGLGFGVWWYLNTYTDYNPEDARSYLLLLFVFMQNIHVFNCRSERRTAFGVPLSGNWLLPVGVLAAQGIHQLAAFIPYLNDILQIRPMPYEVQFTMFGLSLAMLVVMELFKLIYNRWVDPQFVAKT